MGFSLISKDYGGDSDLTESAIFFPFLVIESQVGDNDTCVLVLLERIPGRIPLLGSY